jgi:hypothetical protein
MTLLITANKNIFVMSHFLVISKVVAFFSVISKVVISEVFISIVVVSNK